MEGPVYLIIIITLASLPIIITYLYLKQISSRFSIWLFITALAVGALSMLAGSVLQFLLPLARSADRFSLIYTVFFRNAFTEELGRYVLFLLLFFVLPKLYYTQETGPEPFGPLPRDLVIFFGILAGFSFAMLETLSYGLLNVQLIIVRTLTSAPLHAACGARIALSASLTTSGGFARALFYGVSAVLIHGIYNLLLLFPSALAVLPVILAYVALGSALALAKK